MKGDMGAYRRRADGELGESLASSGAERYVPAASRPWISKRDFPLNNSFQWEPSEHTHSCMVLSYT